MHGGAWTQVVLKWTACCWSRWKKVGYLLSLSHIASCSNTLKNLRPDALSKASMLSNFKHQWNIMTQNRRWPEKFRIFLSPSKLSYHISRTWYRSQKTWKCLPHPKCLLSSWRSLFLGDSLSWRSVSELYIEIMWFQILHWDMWKTAETAVSYFKARVLIFVKCSSAHRHSALSQICIFRGL